jgi:putative salt-induced outer membrane protein YdiY
MNTAIKLSIIIPLLFTGSLLAGKITLSDVDALYSLNNKVKATKELKQSIHLGFANTTGNTDTLNLNGKYAVSLTISGYNDKALKVAFDTSAFLTENDGTRDNEEYTAGLGLEQSITEGWLGYASINWLRNQFTNYDNEFSIGTGIGKELYNDGQHIFKAKLGVAYNVEDYSNDQENKKFGSLNQYFEYHNTLNETSTLYVKLGAMENFKDFSNDYQFTVVAGFNFAVAENLSVTIAEEVRYDALPPVSFDKTDTKSIVRIGYSF